MNDDPTVAGFDDGLDLAPRTDLDDAQALRRELRQGQRKWLVLACVVIIAALGFLVLQFLRDATVFFRNVDEAVAERD